MLVILAHYQEIKEMVYIVFYCSELDKYRFPISVSYYVLQFHDLFSK